MEWTENIIRPSLAAHPEESAKDPNAFVWVLKKDWYDLDFRYLKEHPDFRAFHLYEDAPDIKNDFMKEFAEDAFENRREYICGYYRSDNHGDLYRDYRYLTKERSDRFVEETTEKIMGILREENKCR